MPLVAREPSLHAIPPARGSGRVRWVNAAKGIGIILVVYGHAGRGVIDPDPETVKQGIAATAAAVHRYACTDRAIYAFHMALFFFLSGLFVERGAQKSSITFFGQKLRTIVYPYFLWAIIQCLFVAVATREISPGHIIARLPLEPYAQFWFLYALMLCMTLFWLLYQLKLGRIGILIVAVAAYLFGSLVHLSPHGVLFSKLSDWRPMYETRMYFIYFAAGACLAPMLLRPVTKIPATMLALLGATLLGGEFWLANDFSPTHLPRHLMGIADFARSHGLDARDWVAILPATMGIAGSYAIASALVRWKVSALLEWFGELTLPIYVAQVIAAAAMRVALVKALHVHQLSIHLLLGTIAGLAAPVAMDVMARRVGFNYLFTFGSQKSSA